MTGPRDQIDHSATMSFGDHLEELRLRILLAAAPALPLAIVFYFFSNTFIKALVLPLRRVLEAQGLPPEIQALSPPEVLVTQLKLSLIFAAVVTAPWMVWQAWLFVRPGLYNKERRFVHLLVPGSAVLTAAGIALLYYVMLPLMLVVLVAAGAEVDLGHTTPTVDPRVAALLESTDPVPALTAPPDAPGLFLLVPAMELKAAVLAEDGTLEVLPVPRQQPARITQTYRLSTYVSFVLLLLVGTVVAFQMPLVILLLGWVGLADPAWLVRNRKYALMVCAVLSAVLTPSDVVSMLVLLVPLYALYELGIVLLRAAPPDAVAEGRVLAGLRPRRSRGANNEAPDKRSGQPVKPAQPDGSVPRGGAGHETSEDPDGGATDGESDHSP